MSNDDTGYSYSYSHGYGGPDVDVALDMDVDIDDEINAVRQIVRTVIIVVITAILCVCFCCFAVGIWAGRVATNRDPPAPVPRRHRVAAESSASATFPAD